jgi:hypothetical protein
MLSSSEWTRLKRYKGASLTDTNFGTSRIRNPGSNNTDVIGFRSTDYILKSEVPRGTTGTNTTQLIGYKLCSCPTFNVSKAGLCPTCKM